MLNETPTACPTLKQVVVLFSDAVDAEATHKAVSGMEVPS
jgi:hypothetical protein